MKPLLRPCMMLSAFGLALCFLTHFAAMAGISLLGGWLFRALIPGVVVVWIPALMVSSEMTRFLSRWDHWKIAHAGCPTWMRNGYYGLLAYFLINVMVSAGGKGGLSLQSEDLHSVRAGSSLLMFFYGTAVSIFYSAIHAPQICRPRRCPKGHGVPPLARFCAECGFDFSSDSVNRAIDGLSYPDTIPGPECGQCGISLKPGRKDCHWCGWKPAE